MATVSHSLQLVLDRLQRPDYIHAVVELVSLLRTVSFIARDSLLEPSWKKCQRMRCPFCEVDNDRVMDSRTIEDGFAIRRRRECVNCKRRFTTYERLEEMNVSVIKKNGTREPFSREKMRAGIAIACGKRPISDEQIDATVTAIESVIYGSGETEQSSHDLGEMVMEHLARLDQVAYVRFASVYREFQDVHDFVDELQPILNQRPAPPRHSKTKPDSSGL